MSCQESPQEFFAYLSAVRVLYVSELFEGSVCPLGNGRMVTYDFEQEGYGAFHKPPFPPFFQNTRK